MITERDLRTIWNWNARVPLPVEACVHKLFMEKAHLHPAALAICAWDGELTYQELDSLSSRLAMHLMTMGCRPGMIAPLCFEKSKWMPVAAIGVMKAGGACLALDISLSEDRLAAIIRQSQPTPLVVCSIGTEDMIRRHHAEAIVRVDTTLVQRLPVLSTTRLPDVDPIRPALVLFTSGTTGNPKGVVLTHVNICSALRHHREVLSLQPSDRMFDFSSYSFDAAWSNLVHTITSGACLCVPSESDRKGDLARVISDFKATQLQIPPSAATLLDPRRVPTLKTLVLAGESIPASLVSTWASAVELMNGYGPAECTVMATFARLSHPESRLVGDIGQPVGQVAWVVDPGRGELAPIGTVGELWLEGPLVGKEYLHQPERTASSFITDPYWLTKGAPGYPGRRGRLYRTGDLVRYCADGSLDYIGRIDRQVKVRGQRVDLGNIERCVQLTLATLESYNSVSVVVEFITPRGMERGVIVAFLAIGSRDHKPQHYTPGYIAQLRAYLEENLDEDELSRDMLPAAYLPMEAFPLTPTDKTDRRHLREMGAAHTLADLVQLSVAPLASSQEPRTQIESQLQALCAMAIGVDATRISMEDSFIRAGGDSISAMRVVVAAYEQGWSYSVADILGARELGDLARLVARPAVVYQDPAPFALIDAGQQPLPGTTFAPLDIPADRIRDVYPLTLAQTMYVTAIWKFPPGPREYFFFQLPRGGLDIPALRNACLRTWQHVDILRTVFVQSSGGSQVQVVLDGDFPLPLDVLETEEDLSVFSDGVYAADALCQMDPGRPFTRFILTYTAKGPAQLSLRLSHAQYDGQSMPLLCACISAFYNGQEPPPAPKFSGYIRQTMDKQESARKYWSSLLQGSERTQLRRVESGPHNTSPAHTPNIGLLTRRLAAPKCHRDFTPATLFAGLVAQTLAQVTRTQDVVFGWLVSGRASLPPVLQGTIGPCLAVLPLRVNLVGKQFGDLLLPIHEQLITGQEYEVCGYKIGGHSSDCINWAHRGLAFTAHFINLGETQEIPGLGCRLRQWKKDVLPHHTDGILFIAQQVEDFWDVEIQANVEFHTMDTLNGLLDQLAAVVNGV